MLCACLSWKKIPKVNLAGSGFLLAIRPAKWRWKPAVAFHVALYASVASDTIALMVLVCRHQLLPIFEFVQHLFPNSLRDKSLYKNSSSIFKE